MEGGDDGVLLVEDTVKVLRGGSEGAFAGFSGKTHVRKLEIIFKSTAPSEIYHPHFGQSR